MVKSYLLTDTIIVDIMVRKNKKIDSIKRLTLKHAKTTKVNI